MPESKKRISEEEMKSLIEDSGVRSPRPEQAQVAIPGPRLGRRHQRLELQMRMTVPQPGFVWNPLRGLPRNMRCPCLSQKKFKVCCLPNLPVVVSVADAETLRAQMKLPDMVFQTRANEQLIESVARRQLELDPEGI